MAAELFNAFGDKHQAGEYSQLAQSLIDSTQKLCWNSDKKLLADTPEKYSYSQHANILAVLTNMFNLQKNKTLFEKILNDESLTQTTLYFKFYLVEAMKEAELTDDYLNNIGAWKDMIDIGLTTFAETPEPTRSDCHAWSASPNYHFLSVVCGINPMSPGFKTVIIEPHLGALNSIECSMPHPDGNIIMKLKRQNETEIKGEIILPKELSGKFVWGTKEIILNKRKNIINIWNLN
jgi:hypothetical protein